MLVSSNTEHAVSKNSEKETQLGASGLLPSSPPFLSSFLRGVIRNFPRLGARNDLKFLRRTLITKRRLDSLEDLFDYGSEGSRLCRETVRRKGSKRARPDNYELSFPSELEKML